MNAIHDNVTAKKPESCLGIRHLQAVMLFSALVLTHGMRSNMSIAVVAMTDNSDENAFDWSIQTQSVIFSSFFWGYLIVMIPAGELAARFGGAVLITMSMAVNSTMSLITPVAAHYGGWQAVSACRALQGMFQGVTYPSIHHLIGKWIPLEERGTLGSLIYAGALLGIAVQLMASGFIAHYWGWPAIFYVNGCFAAIWTAFYMFLGANSPYTARLITDEERLYIQTSLGHVSSQKKLKTPWVKMITSLPFIALTIAQASHGWGSWTLLTEMPSYFNKVLGVDIKSNGIISALPYLVSYLLSFPFGFLSDYIIQKGYMSITGSRKLFNSISTFGPAIALIGLSYSPAGNVTAAVTLLSIVVGLEVGYLTGFLLVHIDMAPNFAGSMMSISNFAANCAVMIAPLAAGVMLKDETDASEWRKVFYVSSAIYAIGNVIFLIFGTSETQTWNNCRNETDDHTATSEVKTEKVV